MRIDIRHRFACRAGVAALDADGHESLISAYVAAPRRVDDVRLSPSTGATTPLPDYRSLNLDPSSPTTILVSPPSAWPRQPPTPGRA